MQKDLVTDLRLGVGFFCFVFEVCPCPPSKKKMPKLPQCQKRGEELCL